MTFFGTFTVFRFILHSIVTHSTLSFPPIADTLPERAKATIKKLVDFIAVQSQKISRAYRTRLGSEMLSDMSGRIFLHRDPACDRFSKSQDETFSLTVVIPVCLETVYGEMLVYTVDKRHDIVHTR